MITREQITSGSTYQFVRTPTKEIHSQVLKILEGFGIKLMKVTQHIRYYTMSVYLYLL